MNGPSLFNGLILGIVGGSLVVRGDSAPEQTRNRYCPVFFEEPLADCERVPEAFVDFSLENHTNPDPSTDVLEEAYSALVVLQRDYFDTDWGTWPEAIDWTAAVAGTVVMGMLTTLTRSLGSVDLDGVNDEKAVENLVSSYYAQVVYSYFSQDILSIRGQAYDDMLWVVLGWVEALRLISIHGDLHFPDKTGTPTEGLKYAMTGTPWHGQSWAPQFAHRCRVFWYLAASGWDNKLCNGGMVWNPHLSPYKNAITNELWISASIGMYRYFPGDDFMSPWSVDDAFPGKDPAHLAAAVEGYKWLKDSNMTNSNGLFVDGYHIDFSKPGNKKCDLRDEMVYSYNQGVILTGQRGLWTASGSPSYLEEGHVLIQAVIRATGWDLKKNIPMEDIEKYRPGQLPPWHGLGRGGIMEERCDVSGTCSQDGQIFKGIFFHHLGTFCEELEPVQVAPGHIIDTAAYRRVKRAHTEACISYLSWVRHNMLAALETRDEHGRFGMWWGADLFHNVLVTSENDGIDHHAANTTDYRNRGTPEDSTWGRHKSWQPGSGGGSSEAGHHDLFQHDDENNVQQALGRIDDAGPMRRGKMNVEPRRADRPEKEDPNARGLGRTLETQIGGLALLRAYWEMSQPPVPEAG